MRPGLATRDMCEGIGPAIRSGHRAADAILKGTPYTLADVTGASLGGGIASRLLDWGLHPRRGILGCGLMALTSDKPIIWGAATAVVAGVIVLYLYAHRPPEPSPPASAPEISGAPAALAPVASAPVIEHPVPDGSAPDSPPVPALNQSDKPFHDALTSLPGAQAVEKLLVPDNMIRNIVVTVDNLSRKRIAVDQRPIKATSGQFMIVGTGDQLTINPENYARYRPFMDVVKSVDTTKLVQLYFHFYPLFQNAFDDLGYQNAYSTIIWSHRLITCWQHLMSPDRSRWCSRMSCTATPIRRSKRLSPGQKTLIRMGPANETLIKTRLQELKAQLLAHPREHP